MLLLRIKPYTIIIRLNIIATMLMIKKQHSIIYSRLLRKLLSLLLELLSVLTLTIKLLYTILVKLMTSTLTLLFDFFMQNHLSLHGFCYEKYLRVLWFRA